MSRVLLEPDRGIGPHLPFTTDASTQRIGALHLAATTRPGNLISAPRWATLAGLIAAQAGVALLINSYRTFALVQAAGIAGIGLYAVVRRNLALILCLVAYLPGAEMLWRQTKAPMYYLVAPYLVIMLAGFAVVGVLGRLTQPGRMALLYVGLLAPAMVVTIKTAGPGSREIISFALTGPAALAVLIMFAAQLRVERWLYVRVLWITAISAVGPLTIAVTSLRSTLAAGESAGFTDASNFTAAGGTAPVQVSALLGLGVLCAVLLILAERDQLCRIVAILLGVAFTVQCFLTFSRGGMTSVVIALSALAITQAGNRELRGRILVLVVIGLALCFGVIFPRLDSFTNGAFKERFTDSQTGRTELAANDLTIFRKNPLFGVGPGMTKYQRLGYDVCQLRSDRCANEGSSHTEFTRMLSEHGVPGLLAMVVLLALFVKAIRRSGPAARPFTIAMLTWGIAQMFYANFRIVAVPFAIGLAFVTLREPDAVPEPVPA